MKVRARDIPGLKLYDTGLPGKENIKVTIPEDPIPMETKDDVVQFTMQALQDAAKHHGIILDAKVDGDGLQVKIEDLTVTIRFLVGRL